MLLLVFFSQYLSAMDTSTCNHSPSSFKCVKYLKNYDGDTASFDIPNVHPLLGKNIKVRIQGIDAPEIRTKNKCEKEKARQAKRLVENLLKHARIIHLEEIKRDKYFRIVATIKIDQEKSIAAILLKNGLAYHYGGATKKKVDWCKTTRQLASELQ